MYNTVKSLFVAVASNKNFNFVTWKSIYNWLCVEVETFSDPPGSTRKVLKWQKQGYKNRALNYSSIICSDKVKVFWNFLQHWKSKGAATIRSATTNRDFTVLYLMSVLEHLHKDVDDLYSVLENMFTTDSNMEVRLCRFHMFIQESPITVRFVWMLKIGYVNFWAYWLASVHDCNWRVLKWST